MDFLTPNEVRLLLENTSSHQWYCFFLIAVTTGMRIGELLVMRWRNIDWEKGKYYVRETLIYVPKEKSIGVPKSDSSTNSVDLTPSCLHALKIHRENQEKELSKKDQKLDNEDFIFCTSKGTPYDRSNVANKEFFPILKRAGLRRIRLHDLRHTCASLLINQNENPKYIQRQLRHSSAKITFDTYGHLFPDQNQEVVKRLDETLFGLNDLDK